MTNKGLDSLLRDAIRHAKEVPPASGCTVDGVVRKDDTAGRSDERSECEMLPRCGFFKKYQAVKDLACRGFIRMYCRGSKMDECKRKEYCRTHGAPPSDDMMPSGQQIAMSYREQSWMAAFEMESDPLPDSQTRPGVK